MRVSDEMVRAEINIMERVAKLPIDPLALAVASNIWRASQVFRNTIESSVLRANGLTWASFSTLFIVWVWEPIGMSAIAESQNVSRPTITSTIGLLEKRGLCIRRPSNNGDGRSIQVHLTPAGQELIEDVFPQVNQGEAAFVSGLSAEERQTLATLLRKLLKQHTSE
ncbi:MAG: MarR family winged helix-turn-helix transcriptional regulator [Candidatus Promineifilaceae bacterium]